MFIVSILETLLQRKPQIVWTTAIQLYHNNFRLVGGIVAKILQNPVVPQWYSQPWEETAFFYFVCGCLGNLLSSEILTHDGMCRPLQGFPDMVRQSLIVILGQKDHIATRDVGCMVLSYPRGICDKFNYVTSEVGH